MTIAASLKDNKVEVLSTIVDEVSLNMLQKSLDRQRNVWINAYLAQDFNAIAPLLSPDFRCINGKESSDKAEWQALLQKLWQAEDWIENPLVPNRTRYHFFTPNECMGTLYFKNAQHANVMQELWMKHDDSWKFTALSTIKR